MNHWLHRSQKNSTLHHYDGYHRYKQTAKMKQFLIFNSIRVIGNGDKTAEIVICCMKLIDIAGKSRTTTTTTTMSNEINDKCRWINVSRIECTESYQMDIFMFFLTSWNRFNFIYRESHSTDNEQTMRQDTMIKCAHTCTHSHRDDRRQDNRTMLR